VGFGGLMDGLMDVLDSVWKPWMDEWMSGLVVRWIDVDGLMDVLDGSCCGGYGRYGCSPGGFGIMLWRICVRETRMHVIM